MPKTIKPGTNATRSLAIQRAEIDDEARTVSLAFSSETPYERWWGVEILDHAAKSVRLDRLKTRGPLLIDHSNSIRSQVGVIESVEIGADKVGRAVVRFGKDADADTIFQRVKDGIVSNVSVGYVIHKAVLEETGDDVPDTYRVTDWEPLEVSLVAVPADPSVGVGRSAGQSGPSPIIETKSHEDRTMPDQNVDVAAVEKAAAKKAMDEANKAALTRTTEIIALGEMHAKHGGEKLAAEALRAGKTTDEFRAMLLEHLTKEPKPSAEIGLTKKEAKSFSMLRAINALANPGDRRMQEAAAFERECSDAYAQRVGKSAQGFFVPVEVQQRDLLVGTATAGGHTVATDLLASSFIELLRNRMMVDQMGATILTGLVGPVAIPRQTAGATAYWVAENGAPSESQQAFDQVTMSPKTVGAFTDISRKLLMQSSIDVESFVRGDLATVLALAIDLAALHGTGSSNQPTGIAATSGIGSVAGGTNGLAPTWANMVDLETQIAVANADVANMGYLTNAKVRGKLKVTPKVSSTDSVMIWDSSDSPINGYRAGVSNQVASNLTKGTSTGVCSAIFFGNWADLIIGQWGTLDLTVDPYTGSTAGTVRVVALQDVDVVVRHAASFSAMLDALTA